MWELLVAIEEELDTSQPLLFRLELEAPAYRSFDSAFGASLWAAIARRVFDWQGLIVSDFCGDLVRSDAVAPWPRFDYVEIFWRSAIRCSNA